MVVSGVLGFAILVAQSSNPDLDLFREYGAIATLAAFALLWLAGRIWSVKAVDKLEAAFQVGLAERDARIAERDRTIDQLLKERDQLGGIMNQHLGLMEKQNEVLDRMTGTQ